MPKIKTTIVILQSLDGFIARNQEDNLSWGSSQDKEHFRSFTMQIGCMIMGSNTYNKMPPTAFDQRFSLVLTSTPDAYADNQNVSFRDFKPQEALEYLESLNYTQVAIIGGGKINNSFLQAGLVDEIYITIAPKIFAYGIPSFSNLELNVDLELLEFGKISQNELLLRYKVS